MRIVWFVNAEFPAVSIHLGRKANTGSGSWMKQLLVHLAPRDDCDIHVVYSNVTYRHSLDFDSEKVHYHCLPRRRASARKGGAPEDIDTCIALLSRIQPDVVHIFGTERYYGLMTPRIPYPVVIRLQGILSSYERHFFDGLPERTLAFHPAMLRVYFAIRRKAVVERKLMAVNTVYEGQTAWDRSWAAALAPSTTYFKNAPIVRQPFRTQSWDITSVKRFRILTIASPLPYKGLHLAVEACGYLRKYFPDVRLALAGKLSRHGYGAFVRSRIRKRNLDEAIEHLGFLDEESLATALLECHVFVLPSFIENESLALIEAMSCGVPCVAAFSGGMASTVENECTGLFFPPGEAAVLASHIKRIFEDDALAVELSSNARETTRKKHNPERIVEKTLKMYRELTGYQNANH